MNHSFVFFLVVLLPSFSSSGRNTIHAFAPPALLAARKQQQQQQQQQHKWHLRNPLQTVPSHHHHYHRHHHQTQLLMSSSSNLPGASSMRVKELRAELQSYGISTKSFFEKSELVEAVVEARKDSATPTGAGGADADSSSSTSSDGGGGGSSSSSTASSSSSSSTTGSRVTQLAKEIEKCNSMKVSELRSELASYGISTKSFFEKSEFVRACAEARVEGSRGNGGGGDWGDKQEEYDPSYRDVVMQKMGRDEATQMGFGGGGFGAGKTSTIDIRLG